MNSNIVCPECNTPNSLGSKFCNHCGSRLPRGATLICPNCQTPNPSDRFYCDSCGSRLVEEEFPKEEPEPEEPSPGAKPFSLPAREPGDTGELDPDTVPDWLKTGETRPDRDTDEASQDSADQAPDSQREEPASGEEMGDEENLPELGDLTPAQKAADDLPDWLIDSENEELIIDSPKEITTDYFLDLVNEGEDAPEGEDTGYFIDDETTAAASEANLPDWLSGLDEPAEAELATPDEEAVEAELSDWLDDLSQPAAAETGTTEESTTEAAEAAVDQPPADMTAAEELPDWTTELEHPDTGGLSLPDDSVADQEAEIPDWLTGDLEQPDTGSLSQPDETTAGEEEIPDWLADDFEPVDTDSLSQPADSVADVNKEVTDWLSDLDSIDSDASAPKPTEEVDEPLPQEEESEEALPPWLADMTTGDETESTADSDEMSDDLTALFTDDQAEAEATLDWLTEVEEAESVEADEEGDQEEIPIDQPDEAADEVMAEVDESPLTTDPDWLNELSSLDEAAWAAEEGAVEAESDVESAIDAPGPEVESPTGEVTDKFEEESISEAEHAQEDDEEVWADLDEILGGVSEEEAVEEELPAWMEQLGPPVPDQEEEESTDQELIPSDDLPEWIASLKPGSGYADSSLPSALSLPPSDPDTAEEIPEELTGTELPDWLQDVPVPEASDTTAPPSQEPVEAAEWLQEEIPAEISSEWMAMLSDLPPTRPPEEDLAEADIPEWVQALKPLELTGEEPEPEPEAPPVPSGPLAGLRNVVEIEPVVAMPRTAGPISQFTITKEQKQQATLLRQVTQAEQKQTTTIESQVSAGISAWTRVILAALLIIAIFLGLLGPNLRASNPALAPPDVQDVNTAVNNAAGRPVLVAFEYTPALAGELNPQAELLLAQLEANDSSIITVSQYAAGTALAATNTEEQNAHNLGLIPGEGIGLRQLGNCIGGDNSCATIFGRPIEVDVQQALDDVGLIILLTGERDSLVNWIEQVGTVSNVPMLAGITQSLGPIAAPYLASGQLQGVVEGLPAVVAYQEIARSQTSAGFEQQLNAQNIAQLLAVAVLLIGALIYGIGGAGKGSKRKK